MSENYSVSRAGIVELASPDAEGGLVSVTPGRSRSDVGPTHERGAEMPEGGRASHVQRRLDSRDGVGAEVARLESRGFRVSQRSADEAHVAVLLHHGEDGATVALEWDCEVSEVADPTNPIDLRDVVDEARARAVETRDPIHLAAAQVLDSIELVLRRHAAGVLTEHDKATLVKFERLAFQLGSTRTREERWTGASLPARANLDRHARTRDVLDLIRRLILAPSRKDQRDGKTRNQGSAAKVLVSLVWTHGLVDTRGRSKTSDTEAARLALAKAARIPTPLDEESLLVLALKSCGVPQGAARNMARAASQ